MNAHEQATDELLSRAPDRPWNAYRYAGISPAWCLAAEPKGRTILLLSNTSDSAEGQAVCELAARAVNSFEAMREALKELKDFAEWVGTPRGYSAKDFAPMLELAEKALELSEGKAVQS